MWTPETTTYYKRYVFSPRPQAFVYNLDKNVLLLSAFSYVQKSGGQPPTLSFLVIYVYHDRMVDFLGSNSLAARFASEYLTKVRYPKIQRLVIFRVNYSILLVRNGNLKPLKFPRGVHGC